MENNDDADADPANVLPQILLIVVLTLINAFFASAEMAVVSINKNKIKRLAMDGNKKAKAVEKLTEDETKFLSTIQVGITLAGFFSSATAALTLSDGFGNLLSQINIPYSNQIATVLITILLSFITLIFGELFPKRIALRNPEATSMKYARTLLFIKMIFTPFVKVLSGTCNLLVKITGVEKGINEEKISDNDVIDVVNEGIADGTFDEEKSKMIESTLKFYHLNASDLMQPRVDVFMINIEDNLQENIKMILEEKYTRIPVYQDEKDNIIGVINTKDLLSICYYDSLEKIDLLSVMRKPYFVHEYIEANDLFKKMKENKEQMAILMDEFGGFSGIVTMEDLIEEIVGNIMDEYDEEDTNITKIDDKTYVVKGITPIHELNINLDLRLDEENTEYDTIAGLIVTSINKIPKPKDDIQLDVSNIHLRVLEIVGHRINKILVEIFEEEEKIEE